MIENIIDKYGIRNKIKEVFYEFDKVLIQSKQSLIETNQFDENIIDDLKVLFDKVTFDVYDLDLVIIAVKFDVFFKSKVVGKYFQSFSLDLEEFVDCEIYGCELPFEERELINNSSLI